MLYMLGRQRAPHYLVRAASSTATRVLVRHCGTKVTEPQHIILRPYQKECLDACLQAHERGVMRVGVSLPTGSGKTVVFVSLLSKLPTPPGNPDATRTLVIVSSVELARQTAEQARRMFPQWTVEIEQGQEEASGLADLTVATVHTLSRPDRLRKFHGNNMKAIIVDEAHHAAAPSYRSILSHFNPSIDHPDPTFIHPVWKHRIPIFGFSATFSRHDGLALASVFDDVVYHRTSQDMVEEGWLCDMRFTTVTTEMGLGDVARNKRTGDFSEGSLAEILNTDEFNNLVVKTWQDRAGDCRSTLVFCVNLAHVAAVTEAFVHAGVDAHFVSGRTSPSERASLVEDFKAGKFPVLVNCAVFTEGTDIPNIDCVMLVRPTMSMNLLNQMVGRGRRLSPGKTDCHVIDFADSRDHVAGLLSPPALFGKDPAALDSQHEYLDCETRKLAVNEAEGVLEELRSVDTTSLPPVVYVEGDNPFAALPDQASGDSQLRYLSWNNWIYYRGGFYALDCFQSGAFSVTSTARKNGVVKYVAQHTSRKGRTKKLATTSTLAEAIHHCDARAAEWTGRHYRNLLRSARWRWQPASEAQKQVIRKGAAAYIGLAKQDGKNLSHSDLNGELGDMRKGTASNIISRMFNDAPNWEAYCEKKQSKSRPPDDRPALSASTREAILAHNMKNKKIRKYLISLMERDSASSVNPPNDKP